MNIVMIGSGNVAATLGRRLIGAGHRIVQVYGRNAATASALAYEWETASANYTTLINKNADLYIIAISDQGITSLVKDLHLPGKMVVHTAGAVKMDVLQPVTQNYGVLYPLQSLRKEMPAETIPIYIEAANNTTKKVLEELAFSISPGQVAEAGYDKRIKLHVAAVMVNNFINHILHLAQDFCKKEQLEFEQLLPLINNTIQRIAHAPAGDLQTGPAARNDMETIHKHEALLQEHPALLSLYQFMTNSIITHR